MADLRKPLDTQDVLSNVEAAMPMNSEDGKMPYGLFDPNRQGKLKWICGPDQDQRITSVFIGEEGGKPQKMLKYLNDEAEARYFRDTLKECGWQPLRPPKLMIQLPGQEPKPADQLTRAEKRAIAKHAEKITAERDA